MCYFDMYRIGHLIPKPKPTVLHRETCPKCGRNLVNLYYSEQLNKYICKKCTDDMPGKKGGAV